MGYGEKEDDTTTKAQWTGHLPFLLSREIETTSFPMDQGNVLWAE